MAPKGLKTLTALQRAREIEIESIGNRLRGKSRDSLNGKIVQSRIDALAEIWKDVRNCHSEIVVRGDAENDVYVTDDWFSRIQGVYEAVLDECLILLAGFEEEEERKLPVGAAKASLVDAGSSGVATLPRMPLPTFSGEYEDWASFCDLFTSLVHDAPRLSDATKLQYLKSCLKGSAANLLKDVTSTNVNYASTWQTLKVRYHNPRFIVHKLLTSFMEIPHLKRESASELRFFVDEAQRIVRALGNLNLPVEHWDVWLIFILSERLDPESRRLWEAELSERDSQIVVGERSSETDYSRSCPRFSDLVRFVEKRFQALGMIASDRQRGNRQTPATSAGHQSRKIFHACTSQLSESGSFKCPLCSGMHPLSNCVDFKNKSPYERLAAAKRLLACFNCLGSHRVDACHSSGRCSVCHKKHHTLLHLKQQGSSQTRQQIFNSSNGSQEVGSTGNPPVACLHASGLSRTRNEVLLATARVQVLGPGGCSTYVRALLDQGSEASFVSETIVQLLGLTKERILVPLLGLGASTAGTARSKTSLILKSCMESEFELKLNALILPRLTSQIPTDSISDLDLEQFGELTLADPQFIVSGKIDLILGADVYGQLLRGGLRRFPPSQLVAQNTAFGWIVSGAFQVENSRRAERFASHIPKQALLSAVEPQLDRTLQRFWELEDLQSSTSKLKPEDQFCEQLFRDTHTRNSEGRYEVRLPLKPGLPSLGSETRRMAIGSLSNTYRRLARDPDLAHSYQKFMEEYERLGHMTRVPHAEIHRYDAWYMPHFAVRQVSDSVLKTRVVFDGARVTRSGCCLNQFLLPGAPLQNDLSLVLLNWRRYPFAFTADIVKMFRQVMVNPVDQDFQRIVWAPTSQSTPVDYRLTTVTYGTACAPFLAIRTLLQLVDDEGSKFPLGAACLKSETYVDDTFAGADELSTAVQKRVELTKLLSSAGISLDKWAATHTELLPPEALPGSSKQIDDDKSVKTLGVHWCPALDQFRFDITDIAKLSVASTKRAILSNIARLFDPLGWLAPVTVSAKILMQDLWIQKCEWDSPLPEEFRERWYTYCQSLSKLSSLAVDRWLGVTTSRSYQIHGFSDASSRAYAAVVYIRVDDGNGQFNVSLVAAKTKVAPVKTISIPNLELCGAVLLTKLICHMKRLDFLSSIPVYAWSDSEIVLIWLRKHPCNWKVFVANRVSYIQTELPSATWAHVPSGQNPSDLATRGAEPERLAQNDLWWHGPSWLSQPPERWPQPTVEKQILHTRTLTSEPAILTKFSTLTCLIRVVAFCRRPILNLRRRKLGQEPLPSFLTSSELSEARHIIIRLSQASCFEHEIETLKAGRKLPRRSRLNSLLPFIGQDGILRVGGRLSHSNLSLNCKHPPILARNSALSLLFVRFAHKRCLHGGPTLTSSVLMQQVWILGRNRLVKSMIRTCVTCQRVKPQFAHQLMGDLPEERVTSGTPFSVAGLDYAGPIHIRTSKGRGHRSYKGYIVVFVCFSTKAIHLEAVSDLTSSSFINAYRRFVGRRRVVGNVCGRRGSVLCGNQWVAQAHSGWFLETSGPSERTVFDHPPRSSRLASQGVPWKWH